jgi:hypothetical protein
MILLLGVATTLVLAGMFSVAHGLRLGSDVMGK